MELEKIISNITAGLTGDTQSDIAYLKQQIEEHRQHEYAQEITRACGRILYRLMPQEDKTEYQELMERQQMGMEATLEEIQFAVFRKEYKRAEQMLRTMIDKFETGGMFRNDQLTEYHSFYEPFEEVLYRFVDRPKKKLHNLELPYARIYHEYGMLLLEQGRYEQAKGVLHKAVRWNPANAQIAFDYMETFKKTGDIASYFRLTQKAFFYAFRREDVAHCYRNLGYYFVQKKLYQAAMGCYLMSMDFDSEDQTAPSELYYIQAVTKKTVNQPTQQELESYAKEYAFPIGADQIVVGMAWKMANKYLAAEKYDAAVYYLKIVYDLTEDEEAKKKLDQIPVQDD